MQFSEILDTYHIDYKRYPEHHHCSPNFLQLDCPYCSKDWGHYRLGYNLTYNYFSCWSCGGVPLIPTLAELLNISISQAKELLKGLDIQRQERLPHTGKLTIPNGVGPLQEPHRKYLQKRGLEPDYLSRVWGVQGIGIASRLTWRLFLPIHQHGKVVSWTTRGLTDREPRYINAKNSEEYISAKQVLFGSDHVRHSTIVVEGPFDVYRIGPGACATMGLVVTKSQLLTISKCSRVCICFDSETQAQARARKLCRDLEVMIPKLYNVVMTSKDPGSASEQEIKELRRRFLD